MRRLSRLTLLFAITSWFTPSSAYAEFLVHEGDYFPELTVVNENLKMTGGRVDALNFLGDEATIEGGEIGITAGAGGRRGLQVGGSVQIKGGSIFGITRTDDFGIGYRPEISIHGYYFQVQDAGLDEYNTYRIQGWLLDWTFIDAFIMNDVPTRTSLLRNNFLVYPSDGLAGDANEDWRVDLVDLNAVRNNFGSPGTGDVNGDGTVDLDDLNAVRDNFGEGNFTFPPGYVEYVYTGTAVPETSSLTLILAAVASLGTAMCVRRRRAN